MKYLRPIVVLFIIASLALTFTVGAKNILTKSAVQNLQNQHAVSIQQTNKEINFNGKFQLNEKINQQLKLNTDLWFALSAILIIGSYLLVKNKLISIKLN